MEEVTSRREAINKIWEIRQEGVMAFSEVLNVLKGLPSGVTRCRDCAHWEETIGDDKFKLGSCDFWEKRLVNGDGFCAWTERRKGV